jgi:hypothetical protein
MGVGLKINVICVMVRLLRTSINCSTIMYTRNDCAPSDDSIYLCTMCVLLKGVS